MGRKDKEIYVICWKWVKMKVNYKIEVHRREKEKNDTILKLSWKNKKSDRWAVRHEDFCCDAMKDAHDQGFITVEINKQSFRDIKYDERDIKLKEPVVCLNSMNEDGYGDEGCPHQEMVLPITNCPFCTASITTNLIEKKRITHTCKKVKHTYEECEDQVKEEILQIR